MRYKPKTRKAIWWKPTAEPKKVRRVRPVSKRQRKRLEEYAATAREWRHGRLCACQGMALGLEVVCRNTPHLCSEVHHSRGRIGSLLMDQRFWIAVCPAAHDWIHRNPSIARVLGLICPPGQWNRPEKEAA